MALDSDVIAFTFNQKRKEVMDAIFDEFAFFKMLKVKASVKLEGGNQIDRAIEFKKNATGAWISGADVVDTTIQRVHTRALWDWRELVNTVQVTATELAQNSGKEAIIRLVDERKANAIRSIQDDFSTAIFAALPASGNKQLETLTEAVANAPTTDPTRGNYGGISRTAATGTIQWRNKNQVSIDSTLTATSVFAFASRGIELMTKGWNIVSTGPGVNEPDVLIGTRELYEAYEAKTQTALQVTMGPNVNGNLGFGSLSFKKAPIIWDAKLTGDNTNGHKMYMLNTRDWELITHRDWDFVMGKFQEPVNQTVLTAKIVWQGNMICKNPIRQLVIAGFTV